MKTNLINKFFNKNVEDIDLNDIQHYFSIRQEESSNIEFKSGEIDIIDIYKEISAFLNTEGGLLIIGSPRETKEFIGKKVIRYCKGDLVLSKFVSKDWLQQKIYSNITPSPIGIFIKEIISEAGNVFLLDIPQSFNPPHQSNADGRYYIRIDNEAKPAPHGLVQALFQKRKVPILNSEIREIRFNEDINDIYLTVYNKSTTPAEMVSFDINIFNVLEIKSKHTFNKEVEDELGVKYQMTNFAPNTIARTIIVPIKFSVIHNSTPYFILISFWCKDVDIDVVFFKVDPLSKKFESGNIKESEVNIFEEIEKIVNLK